MKRHIGMALMVAAFCCVAANAGRYVNPVLASDYSDPDAIRVGSDFYLVSSSFANAPGLPVLTSKDLVHWRIVGHALTRLPPDSHYSVPRHGGGAWAPAIRFHAGKLVIYYPDPDRGIFMVEASDPAGPWSVPVLVDAARGAIDPCPFWDDDGTGWLVHGWAASRAGKNNIITLKKLSADGRKALDNGSDVIVGQNLPPVETSIGLAPWHTIEGPKLYKRNGWYYIFAPAGGVPGGWQAVFRSRHIAGPYEARDVLDQGHSDVNGPHQGAWVTTVSGEDWFLHFQDAGTYGRRVWLEPMIWRDGWPVIGKAGVGAVRGEPVHSWTMPRTAVSQAEPESDEFDGILGKGWQWNANPQGGWSDLESAPGQLRLSSASQPRNLWEDGAILTRKLPDERFTATVKLTFHPKAVGERSGLVMYGSDYAWIGLENTASGIELVAVTRKNAANGGEETRRLLQKVPSGSVYLRLSVEPKRVSQPAPEYRPYWPSMLQVLHADVRFSYSFDNAAFTDAGEQFEALPGRWVGAQIGLFAQAPAGTPSYVATSVGSTDIDWFRISR
ncbi:glycoside hydrolase family 43 protein [Rhizomicrobium electricum]|uniref:Glycoside hydrolase 43 family protein n=1 Tax=Rhizomicrobium electricum TaxID=480070 RepID=A0ABN1ESS2_9PROT|nr:glycoside hydrolase 43 family protein [Rhizomicrobium electricum]NIJ49126.1 beta-xylosidase [Rhizomicrobium electricum]